MKKKFILFSFLFISLTGLAQQRPHYTQYILNNYILNPALTGIENYTDVKISGRDQWQGLNGAPRTAYLSVHTPIGKKDFKTSATSFRIPGENPRGSNYWENYTASKSHHGAGLIFLNDKTGLYNQFTAKITYAYHVGLTPRINLAVGFGGGIQQISYDKSRATPQDNTDPLLIVSNSSLNKMKQDLSAGLWLYSSAYFIGLGARQIIPQKITFLDNAATGESLLIPHIFFSAGYRFLIGEDINALPSAMIKYVYGTTTKPQLDINLKLQYQDLVWLGGGYRLQDGFTALIGINLGHTVNVGYSYDYTINPLRSFSNGSHEFIIGFLLGNQYGDTCPRNVW